MSRPRILVAFDSMRYPNTGLFHFGKSLGRALLRNNDRFDLNFFLHPSTTEFEHDKVNKIWLRKYHKLFYLNRDNIKLFHFTDQIPRLSPHMVKGKRLLTIHDLNQLHEGKSDRAVAAYRSAMQKRIAICDHIVAISKFVADDVIRNFPQAESKLSIIYNGADNLILPTGHIPPYLPQKQFLFTIGILSAKKNFAVLPALLAGNDLELIIAGIRTSYEAQIIAEAERHGCADRVKIIGTISDADKAWYYANCKAFVFPSVAEGFGLPVIEAMYFGKPVFCSRYTSLPEVGGNVAHYFDSFEPDHMQQVLMDGLADHDATNGAERAKEWAARSDWDVTAKQYLSLYEKVLG